MKKLLLWQWIQKPCSNNGCLSCMHCIFCKLADDKGHWQWKNGEQRTKSSSITCTFWPQRKQIVNKRRDKRGRGPFLVEGQSQSAKKQTQLRWAPGRKMFDKSVDLRFVKCMGQICKSATTCHLFSPSLSHLIIYSAHLSMHMDAKKIATLFIRL